jgi:hypothetical protein
MLGQAQNCANFVLADADALHDLAERRHLDATSPDDPARDLDAGAPCPSRQGKRTEPHAHGGKALVSALDGHRSVEPAPPEERQAGCGLEPAVAYPRADPFHAGTAARK